MKEFKQNESKKHDEIQIWCFNNAKKIIVESSLKGISESDISRIYVKIEHPIIKKNYRYGSDVADVSILGYLDLYIEFKINDKWHNLVIEIKPYIFSLGDLIRQIKTYKTHIDCLYIVASPDDRHKSILKSQGILFYKVPEL